MNPTEYAMDITRLDHADPLPEIESQEHEDWLRGKCYNCGCWALENPWCSGEFECPCCGDTWNIYEPPPDIP
jgi:hypothetical protein